MKKLSEQEVDKLMGKMMANVHKILLLTEEVNPDNITHETVDAVQELVEENERIMAKIQESLNA